MTTVAALNLKNLVYYIPSSLVKHIDSYTQNGTTYLAKKYHGFNYRNRNGTRKLMI